MNARLRLNYAIVLRIAALFAVLLAASAAYAQDPNLVKVTTNQLVYLPSQPINVFITDGTPFDIDTYNMQSYCSIVSLQREIPPVTASGGANGTPPVTWMTVAPCPLESPTMLETIDAGETVEVTLPPVYSTYPIRIPGTYRIQFTFFFEDDEDNPVNMTYVVYSPMFKVLPVATPVGAPPPASSTAPNSGNTGKAP